MKAKRRGRTCAGKGSTALQTKCCQGSDLAHRRPGYVEITCVDVGRFRSLQAEECWKVAELLADASNKVADGRMSKTAFSELEVAVGFRYNPHGLFGATMLHQHIDPAKVITYDWVHSMLQGRAAPEKILPDPLGTHARGAFELHLDSIGSLSDVFCISGIGLVRSWTNSLLDIPARCSQMSRQSLA